MRLPATLPLLLAAAAAAQSPEIRATWIARDGLTSRAQIAATLDQLAAANFNTVCVDVWTRGYTVHPSDVLQRTAGVRQDPDYVGRDPLQEVIVEAHRRGLEVEAWFEYGFMACWSGWYPTASGNGPVLTAHPDWAAMDQNGTVRVSDGGTGWFTWLAHEHPAARRFLLDLTDEVAERYDVDGIQWDRIRYPSTAFGYDPATVAAYRASHNNQSPPSNVENSTWKRWRADGLSAFTLQLGQEVHARNPALRVSNAPIPADSAYANYLQDWPAWLVSGAVDFVYPQIYTTSIAGYTALLDLNLRAVRAQDRARFAPGIRAIAGTAPADVLQMVAANRSRGLPGHVFWYAQGLGDDLAGLQAQYFTSAVPLPGRPANWRPLPLLREENDATTVVQGNWLLGQTPQGSGGQALYAPFTSTGQERVTFVLPPSEAGLWTVFASQVPGAGLATAAPHRTTHAAGTAGAWLDQSRTSNAGFRELGTFWLDPALGPCTVLVQATPGATTVADAAMLLRCRRRSGAMSGVGTGTNGSLGVPQLSLGGNGAPGGHLDAQLHAVPTNTLALFAVGFAPAAAPLFGGTLFLQPATLLFAISDAHGNASLPIDLPFAPALVGVAVLVQGAAFDAGAVQGISLSPAARALLQ